MKSQVYSWRVAEEVKADLEREARIRGISVSEILDTAVRDWLKKSGGQNNEEEAQQKIRAAAAPYVGALSGGNRGHAANVRKVIRERLRRRYGR
jgi:post-segregation antitoxin (ccd killing protein)